MNALNLTWVVTILLLFAVAVSATQGIIADQYAELLWPAILGGGLGVAGGYQLRKREETTGSEVHPPGSTTGGISS